MRFKRFLSVAAALAALCASAATPKIEWESQVYDFGAFNEDDGKVSCKIKFVNTGDAPLVVISARTTCGCTMSSFTKRPVEPGDTGAIEVTYNPTGRPGRFDKKVYVETNTHPSRSTLTVKGVVIGASNTIRSRFPVDAGKLKLRNSVVPFSEVMKGRSKTEFLDAYNATGDTLVAEWKNLPPYISVAGGSEKIAPGEYASFAITFSGRDCPHYGVVTDSITLVPDVNSPERSYQVTTVAMVKEDFSTITDAERRQAPVIGIVPETLDFDVINADGGKVSKQVTVKNHGSKPLILRRVYTGDKGISLKASSTKIKKGKTATITVEVDPSKIPDGLLNGKVTVVSNSPDYPMHSFRVTGQVRKP